MANQDPKVTLLRQKLALVAGPNHCSMYNTITGQNPNALHEPWSTTMTESPKYVGTLIHTQKMKMQRFEKERKLAYTSSASVQQ